MNRMSTLTLLGALSALPLLARCGGVEDFDLNAGEPSAGSVLDGLTVLQEGRLIHQEGPSTSGRVALAEDAAGTRFVVLREDFDSDFAVGSVEIYLATSDANLAMQLAESPAGVSPLLGRANRDGAHRFPLPAGLDTTPFTHVIIWCAAVAINFGAAPLQEVTPGQTTLREGRLVHQDGPLTSGTVRIVEGGGRQRLELLEDFDSDFATGTVEIYLARSDENLDAQIAEDPTSVSPHLGLVNQDGRQSFDIPANVDITSFSYVIVWCDAVAINFGAARLDQVGPRVVREGQIQHQDGPPTSGTVQIIDDEGILSVMLLEDFDSDFTTGAVEIFLASSADNLETQRQENPNAVSPLLGRINRDGAHTFALPAGIDADRFSHLIVWCAAVAINFGAAELVTR